MNAEQKDTRHPSFAELMCAEQPFVFGVKTTTILATTQNTHTHTQPEKTTASEKAGSTDLKKKKKKTKKNHVVFRANTASC